MLAILIGLLVTLVLALAVMALVALPHLRTGSRILTPDGERVVQRARGSARVGSVAAAGSSRRLIRRLSAWLARARLAQARLARGWAPLSAVLHERLDALERRDQVGTGQPTAADQFGADQFGADQFGADQFGADQFGADRPVAGKLPDRREHQLAGIRHAR